MLTFLTEDYTLIICVRLLYSIWLESFAFYMLKSFFILLLFVLILLLLVLLLLLLLLLIMAYISIPPPLPLTISSMRLASILYNKYFGLRSPLCLFIRLLSNSDCCDCDCLLLLVLFSYWDYLLLFLLLL